MLVSLLLTVILSISSCRAAGPVYQRSLPSGFRLSCYQGYQLQSSGNFATSGTCLACSPGTAGSDGLRCLPCSVGYNATLNATNDCTICPAGTISVTPASPSGVSVNINGIVFISGVSSGQVCLKCPAGYYQPLPGGHMCVPCAPGEECTRCRQAHRISVALTINQRSILQARIRSPLAPMPAPSARLAPPRPSQHDLLSVMHVASILMLNTMARPSARLRPSVQSPLSTQTPTQVARRAPFVMLPAPPVSPVPQELTLLSLG